MGINQSFISIIKGVEAALQKCYFLVVCFLDFFIYDRS